MTVGSQTLPRSNPSPPSLARYGGRSMFMIPFPFPFIPARAAVAVSESLRFGSIPFPAISHPGAVAGCYSCRHSRSLTTAEGLRACRVCSPLCWWAISSPSGSCDDNGMSISFWSVHPVCGRGHGFGFRFSWSCLAIAFWVLVLMAHVFLAMSSSVWSAGLLCCGFGREIKGSSFYLGFVRVWLWLFEILNGSCHPVCALTFCGGSIVSLCYLDWPWYRWVCSQRTKCCGF